MDPETHFISTRNLVGVLVFVLVLGASLSFLYDLQISDTNAFQVKHQGRIPLVANDEQAVSAAGAALLPLTPSDQSLVMYVEAQDGCNSNYGGPCTNVRSGPGEEFPSVLKLRDGVVLRVEKTVRKGTRDWYKITFDEFVRYPERLGTELYVASDAVKSFAREAPHDWNRRTGIDTSKHIVVDLSEQKLYAYEGDELFMEQSVSTGLDGVPTPLGAYNIFRKMPSRYMQGPIPGQTNDEYDLPGVPWTMYFTDDGAAIHGAYWHNDFGLQHSHGCVNLPPEKARLLYDWTPLGTVVIVRS
jgi:hypothetical protein